MNSEVNILDLPLLNSYNNRLMHHCRIHCSGQRDIAHTQHVGLLLCVKTVAHHPST